MKFVVLNRSVNRRANLFEIGENIVRDRDTLRRAYLGAGGLRKRASWRIHWLHGLLWNIPFPFPRFNLGGMKLHVH